MERWITLLVESEGGLNILAIPVNQIRSIIVTLIFLLLNSGLYLCVNHYHYVGCY